MDAQISKPTSLRLLKSFGVTNVLLSFFSREAILPMQLWNRWMYQKGVPRVLMSWSLGVRYYFFSHPYGRSFNSTLFVFDKITKKLDHFYDERLDLNSRRILQCKDDVLAFSWVNRVSVSRYESPINSSKLKVK